jgi:hypothetical protein
MAAVRPFKARKVDRRMLQAGAAPRGLAEVAPRKLTVPQPFQLRADVRAAVRSATHAASAHAESQPFKQQPMPKYKSDAASSASGNHTGGMGAGEMATASVVEPFTLSTDVRGAIRRSHQAAEAAKAAAAGESPHTHWSCARTLAHWMRAPGGMSVELHLVVGGPLGPYRYPEATKKQVGVSRVERFQARLRLRCPLLRCVE